MLSQTCAQKASRQPGRPRAELVTGAAAAEPAAGSGAEHGEDADSEDERHAEDTPQQHAAALVWDAAGDEASARAMVQHGLLDVCAALLVHGRAAGDGARCSQFSWFGLGLG